MKLRDGNTTGWEQSTAGAPHSCPGGSSREALFALLDECMNQVELSAAAHGSLAWPDDTENRDSCKVYEACILIPGSHTGEKSQWSYGLTHARS